MALTDDAIHRRITHYVHDDIFGNFTVNNQQIQPTDCGIKVMVHSMYVSDFSCTPVASFSLISVVLSGYVHMCATVPTQWTTPLI